MTDVLAVSGIADDVLLHVEPNGQRHVTGEAVADVRSYTAKLLEPAAQWFSTLSCGWELRTEASAEAAVAVSSAGVNGQAGRSRAQAWVIDHRLVVSVSAIPEAFETAWRVFERNVGNARCAFEIVVHLEQQGNSGTLRAALEAGERITGNCEIRFFSASPGSVDDDD